MKRRLLALALSLSAASLATAAEPVATLATQEGVVMVNAGDEFVTAVDNQGLAAGTRVMVMEGGSAQLAFSDGCALDVAPGSLLVVPEASPCAGGIAATQPAPRQYAQARTFAGAGAGGFGSTALVFGVMGLVMVGIANEDSRLDIPVSP